MGENDEALMNEVRKGDVDMLSPLVRKYEKPLFAFIFRILGNRKDAEDLFQETFLRIAERRHTFKENMPFKPWLYSICLNLCRDFLRRRVRHQEILLEEEIGKIPDPGARMTRNLIIYRVKKAIMTLPEKPRVVFLLYYYQGLSYSEIAETVGIPLGTVKSRMHQAVSTLEEELKDLEVDVA